MEVQLIFSGYIAFHSGKKEILAALIITLHCYSDRLTIDVCVSTHLGWCQGSHTAHSFGSFCFLPHFIFSLPLHRISTLRALATWPLSTKETGTLHHSRK